MASVGAEAAAQRWAEREDARLKADGCVETRSLTLARAWLAGRGTGMAEAVAAAPVVPRTWELDVAAELAAAAQGDDETTLRARLERLAAQLRGKR